MSAIASCVLFAAANSVSAQAQQPTASPPPSDMKGCASTPIMERFDDLVRTGSMSPELGRWLFDPKAQYMAPYQAFDNVYYVGVCWVSSWLIKTSEGVILIDTLHEPFVDQLLQNIRSVGVDPKDIKYVLMTHGHFDHVGGAYKLKPLTGAQFVMTQTGWNEAIRDSAASQKSPRPWSMIAQDRVVKDGDEIRLGDQVVRVYETPGHTYGTASYSYTVKEGAKSWGAFTVGGLGLNAIENSRQVEAFIASVDRIAQLMDSPTRPIEVHLTTHPFTNGLTEAKEGLKNRKPGDPHPLVDPQGFRAQLASLRAGAVERLATEKKKEAAR
jgi:metallo-beta-lactamase class B